MRILVATDAWHPQVNGVVRTLTHMAEAARAFGVEVSFLTPQSFRTFAMPSYPDLRLALPGPAKTARLIADARPDSIHIATEGPIGLLVRRYCRKHRLPFTTTQVKLANRADAKAWIVRRQFGRRNLTPFQRIELALKLAPLIAAQAKANRAGAQFEAILLNMVFGELQRTFSQLPGATRDAVSKIVIPARINWSLQTQTIQPLLWINK